MDLANLHGGFCLTEDNLIIASAGTHSPFLNFCDQSFLIKIIKNNIQFTLRQLQSN